MLHALPKVELHVHLDCCLSFEVVSRLRPSISYAEYRDRFVAPPRCTNLADFLTRAPNGFALMQTELEIRAVVADLFRQFQADNVMYAEIRFAPLLHCERSLKPADVVRIVNDAVSAAIASTGIEARIILCTLRHFTNAQSLETVALAERFSGTNVVALDLAGDEAGFPIDAHVPAFEFAIGQQIQRTAHAGEASGAQSVWETLKHFSPARIGHGVRSSEDPALVAYLRDNRIHLEVCPSSNLQTNIYESATAHPVKHLFDSGISLGISTDARTITDTTLNNEYALLHDHFGWSQEEFFKCNANAINAAFLPHAAKHSLLDRLYRKHNAVTDSAS
jgi:adenosine deaminase